MPAHGFCAGARSAGETVILFRRNAEDLRGCMLLSTPPALQIMMSGTTPSKSDSQRTSETRPAGERARGAAARSVWRMCHAAMKVSAEGIVASAKKKLQRHRIVPVARSEKDRHIKRESQSSTQSSTKDTEA
eukprot:scaffold1875_cov253-Pinguiococcus_pyrenoidosus.AAC.29